MRSTRIAVLIASLAAIAGVAVAVAIASPSKSHSHQQMANMQMPGMQMTPNAAPSAADVRVLLDTLLSEHAALAMNATNAGYSGSKAFPAIAKQLDRNSVALSKAIGSIYGAKAAKTFLDGKFMWRDHIRFFVDYTVALAKKDKAGQAKAVANLKRYTMTFGDFLAGATGLPKQAVRADLLGHVFELKNQLDAFARGNYGQSQALYGTAFHHMTMTGDLLAGAITKQKNLK